MCVPEADRTLGGDHRANPMTLMPGRTESTISPKAKCFAAEEIEDLRSTNGFADSF